MSAAARRYPAVDVLVVGAGAAGLNAALEAAPLSVAVLTKTGDLRGGASPLARGGIAAAVGPGDSPILHAADTIAAAAGLADAASVMRMVGAGPAAIDRLARLGMRLDRAPGGGLALAREAAHRRSRIAHAGDATGAELVRALLEAFHDARHVVARTATFASDLLVERGRVAGVRAIGPDGAREVHPARAVVIATGGIGRIFPGTTNPAEATGDGLAAAARAGAALADLEFVQFHPTALAIGEDPMPLLTEALRGAGARLVGATGEPVTLPGGAPAELAPRDVVAASLAERMEAGERTFLDARPVGRERLEREFPGAVATCLEAGLDPARDLLPIAPAAHYHMGGAATDRRARASLPGLWACGEAACTGVHGANRLASNSLLEGLVFGAVAGGDLKRVLGEPAHPPAPTREVRAGGGAAGSSAPWAPTPRAADALRAAVGAGLGVLRNAAAIERMLAAVTEIAAPGEDGELENMALVARLVGSAALVREESRGAHRRTDFPAPRPALAVRRSSTAAEILAAAALATR